MDLIHDALAGGASVITANARLARVTTLEFNRCQHLAGRTAWHSPQVLSWEAWLTQLWAASVEADGAAGQELLLSDVQARSAWQTITTLDHDPPGRRMAVAAAAAQAWRICQDWCITPGDLSRAADSDDTQLFADWANQYQALCAAQGWLDAGSLPAMLARDIQEAKIALPRKLWLKGFEAFLPAQMQIRRVLDAAGCAVVEEPAPYRCGSVHRTTCHDAQSELNSAARWARRQIEERAHARIAVVIPDLAARIADVRRAFLDVFTPDWRLKPDFLLPVNFSYGGPLSRYGIVHAALLILDTLSGRLDFPDMSQLLRCPYLPGFTTEAGARARIEADLRDGAGLQVSLDALIRSAEVAAPIFARSLKSLRTGDSLLRRQDAAGWAGAFANALRLCGWPGDRPLTSDEFRAAQIWQEQLQILASCRSVTGRIDRDSALTLLRMISTEHVFQPGSHPDAVQVLGVLEALGQEFDALWICGMTSQDWPPPPRAHPLLPLRLQRELQMPDSSATAVRERAERRLRWLMASADDVIISWPQFAGDEPLTPSPLIGDLPEVAVAKLPAWSTPLWQQVMAASARTEILTGDPPPAVTSTAPLRGGAKLLELQSRCPARAFLECRLGAKELRLPSPAINPATRGRVTHAALEEFYRRFGSRQQLIDLRATDRRRELEIIIAAALHGLAPAADTATARLIQQEQHRLVRLLEQFLELEVMRPEFSVYASELEPPADEGPPLIARLGLRLRIDRIDQLPDGRRLVIDYKTGECPNLKQLWGRLRAPQLPLYATLMNAQGVAFIQLSANGIKWIGAGDEDWAIPGMQDALKLSGDETADWRDVQAYWRGKLDQLASEFLDGDFRVDQRLMDDAEGDWAMATRIHELAITAEEDVG